MCEKGQMLIKTFFLNLQQQQKKFFNFERKALAC